MIVSFRGITLSPWASEQAWHFPDRSQPGRAPPPCEETLPDQPPELSKFGTIDPARPTPADSPMGKPRARAPGRPIRERMAETRESAARRRPAGAQHAREHPVLPLRRLHGTEEAQRGPRGGRPVEEVGAVPERAAVGHRPRGLQPRRERVGLLLARPVPLEGLPLGRGRPRRDQRRQAAALLRARPLEREGPDPEGADVRPDEQRGEPRRGREGVLLLRRLHADALVHEVPLQVPAGRVPVPGPHRDEPGPVAEGVRVRAPRHGRLRGRPVLGRLRRVRQGRPRGRPRPGDGPQPGARGGADPPPPDALVPEHLDLGRRHEARDPGRGRDDPGDARRARRDDALVRRLPGAPLHGERDERPPALGPAEPVAVRKGLVPPVRSRTGSRTP